MTVKAFLQAGAREILRGIAWDMALIYHHKGIAADCTSLWADAKRFETRFGLRGFTSYELATLEFRAKFNTAVRKIKVCAGLFEPGEIDRMARDCARRDLRDIVNTLGAAAMQERIGPESYATALRLAA